MRNANDTCSEMAGRRACQSGSAKPSTQTQERTTLSPAQVERAVDAIQYLSTIGRTNGDGTTPTTSCSGSNGASDGSSALSRQVESGSGTEASGKC